MKRLLTLTALAASISTIALAQATPVADTFMPARMHHKMYTTSSLDGAIFSMNTASTTGVTNVLRFSYFINTGMNLNYDFNSHLGIYAGLGVKNMGYIDKTNIPTSSGGSVDRTTKHRVYAPGIPIGLKIGSLKRKGTFAILGGGADFPVNYKEKTFTDGRHNKTKFNEWFSNRTEHVLPYVFVGISIKSNLNIKFQYYPNNFMNTSYTKGGVNLYGYDTHLGMLSLSYYMKNKSGMHLKQKMKAMKSMHE